MKREEGRGKREVVECVDPVDPVDQVDASRRGRVSESVGKNFKKNKNCTCNFRRNDYIKVKTTKRALYCDASAMLLIRSKQKKGTRDGHSKESSS